MSQAIMRRLPLARSTTPLQAATYLLGISLFSISFLVFLNSSISFVITDRIGVKTGVGDIVGTLGFVDELVALVACPVWGLVSDRLGVRQVAVIGYAVIALALVLFVQATDVYPQLLLARILFAIGATASATMVTAILPSLTDDSDADPAAAGAINVTLPKTTPTNPNRNPRDSALSIESQLTITPERFAESLSRARGGGGISSDLAVRVASRPSAETTGTGETGLDDNTSHPASTDKPSKLAGFVGLFTGCGALVALALFLPLPAQFGSIDGVTMAEAVAYSFYVVAAVAVLVAVFVFIGLRRLRGEDGKGWRMLLGLSPSSSSAPGSSNEIVSMADVIAEGPSSEKKALPYWRLLRDSIRLGTTDPDIALGYLGGFVARASTVAISLFVPLFVNAFFIGHGFCKGATPNDPSPDLKKECRAAYVLAAILTGVAQLIGLLCAPLFGYLASRSGRIGAVSVNIPLIVATSFGVVGYIAFPLLPSPEIKDVGGRGGSPAVFAVAALLGVSQIGAIVCSLGSLGKGVLAAVDEDRSTSPSAAALAAPSRSAPNADVNASESAPLLAAGGGLGDSDNNHNHPDAALPSSQALTLSGEGAAAAARASRIQLKGSIAGVYSWCGGAAILLLTKLGGFLFDSWTRGAPFYMMAVFNGLLLVASLGIDAGRTFQRAKQ